MLDLPPGEGWRSPRTSLQRRLTQSLAGGERGGDGEGTSNAGAASEVVVGGVQGMDVSYCAWVPALPPATESGCCLGK